MTPNPSRFVLMDSLRAIAALMVFLFHLILVGLWQPPDWLGHYARYLNLGVSIFFVISGFLLYRPFVQARLEQAPRPPLWPYAARRVTRILPAYWLALAVSAALITIPGVFEWPRGLLTFGLAQTYTDASTQDGLPQAWSIAVEISFYAFLPLWALGMRAVRLRTYRGRVTSEIAGLVVLFAAGLVWKTVIAGPGIVEQFFSPVIPAGLVLPNFLDQFALGMALALASVVWAGRERPPAAVRVVERLPSVSWAVAVGLYVLMGSGTGPFDQTDVLSYTLRHEVAGLFGLAVVLPAVFGQERGGAVRWFLALAPLVWVGMVSYGVYLWHVTVQRLVADADVLGTVGTIGATALSLAATLAVAAASWYGLERYAIALGRRAGHVDHTPPEPAGERIAEAHRAVDGAP